jgi:hypothetical protein
MNGQMDAIVAGDGVREFAGVSLWKFDEFPVNEI